MIVFVRLNNNPVSYMTAHTSSLVGEFGQGKKMIKSSQCMFG